MPVTDNDPRPAPTPPCRGWCRGDRSALEPPAQLVRSHANRLLVWCMCCDRPLALARGEYKDHLAAGRLDPSVKPTSAKLFECNNCAFDFILMKELVAKG